MNFLALTGSLRARSINTDLLNAAALLAPGGTTVRVSQILAELPHFNPDLDAIGATPPAAVATLRDAVAAADALLISCPEYAHGVAGAFKNLLDWLVSGPEMVGKVVCVLNASSHATFAPASLVETLRTMSTVVVTAAAITVPVNGRRMTAEAIAADDELSATLRTVLAAVAADVNAAQTYLSESKH
jgi:chromate reductase, NAD(P)H dehydrogenase (quinone)